MSEAFQMLRYEERGNVAVITYDRQERRNALSVPMYREAVAAVERALVLADERDRIAAALNDVVVRRVFALGLSIQRAVGSCASGVQESLQSLVAETDEILAATQFPDQIARCGAPIEEHHAGDDTRWVYLADGATYGIPFRTLQPQGVENVLVAGRCFSATHDAHASARSMGTCMAMGQAAGTAAALAEEPKRLAPAALRGRLRHDGADVGG